ncbi:MULTISPECIES: Cys-tRNA(Pro) deacylase [unclassified Dehalobacter]|uniref:Cys-tRNA(Pro) deacylase n=1 Tax=unclassified Dehalobacter TaxID=2635733 RepID=UPI000E6CF542|nr:MULTISPECIES: Cys-tRNA(Pro) deacylase [unclassified Dehalobacter]RJE46947.1 aminoacyl-tRNA deacylase [Dehalobacter sp. MCB1]TCX50871.1 Cys-tRNA(Pro) deacylase [Dehalobacter sp. 12DCB1]TCX51583.1 Cys-tRNA(Pro) deacylase [Dehalobacter sp. 14DCB1]
MAVNQKTNVIRTLESKEIRHEVYKYEVDDGLIDAISVARKMGYDPDRVFKTLVTTGKTTGINVFVIPGNCELDLKKAAEAAGDKNIEMLKSKELLPLTGYIHGGCSPIGMKKDFPTYLEEMASEYDYIMISAGKIGMQVKIDPAELVKLTDAKLADLV